MRPSSVEMLVNLGPERFWMAAVGGLVLLAWSRNAPLLVQLAAFLVFALGIGGTGALWAPVIVDDFPDFAKALGWTFASGWVGLLLYNLVAIRDYSFLGAYVLIWLSTAISLAIFTWLSDIVLSLAFASFIVLSGFLFYFMYDLSMILRRRRPSQVLAGALDLYRDALNFVGFPVRMMRMPRGVRRARQ
jgi:FtsH-binding integral membrane protein